MKIFVLILSVILCSSLNGQEGKFFLSSFHNDGTGNVPSENFSFSKKGKFYYFISNDKANVYLDLKIDDSEVQSRILLQGLTLWVNMDGKSAKKMGVHFPIGSQHSGGRRGQNTQGTNLDSDGKPLTPLAQANTIELIGFVSEESRRFPAENADSFSGSVSYDKEGILHYQMKLPLVKIPVRNAKEGGGAMPFTLGIDYGFDPNANGNMPQEMKPQASAGAGEISGGGGGGGSRGGSGGGKSGGRGQGAVAPPVKSNSYSAQVVAPPVEFWIKNIKLATEK